MEKKLYYKLSDNADLDGVIMELSGIEAWIEGDADGIEREDYEGRVYTIEPVYLTVEEYNKIPEYDGC